jgi:PncC family amidohydrolase
VLSTELLDLAAHAAVRLKANGHTIGVAEGSCGGLISAALLAQPGASAYYVGGAVVYTRPAGRAYVAGAIEAPPNLRGASEPWVTYLAESTIVKLGVDWAIGEGGAAGPTGNPYGDPAGHAWVAVARRAADTATRHVLTGDDDRQRNMIAFASAAVRLLVEQLDRG